MILGSLRKEETHVFTTVCSVYIGIIYEDQGHCLRCLSACLQERGLQKLARKVVATLLLHAKLSALDYTYHSQLSYRRVIVV